jgi:hypothetical protein
MNKIFCIFHYLIISLLLICSVAMAYALAREFFTWSYLRGFADAILPASASPEEKAEALLTWMRYGPARHSLPAEDLKSLDERDPIDTLNYKQFLEVCGTAVNAYINVANTAGLQVRRLILLDDDYRAKHVVAEVRLGGRWVVVDPAFRILMRDAQGHLLTQADLRDPKTLQEATRGIANYLPTYTYERVTLVRLEKIPYLGRHLRRALNGLFPAWEEAATPVVWVLDRRSSILIFTTAGLICPSLLVHLSLRWRAKHRRGSSTRHSSTKPATLT